jgi:hypothetical protein
MLSQPSSTGQPKPHTNRDNLKKAAKAVLILAFVVVIVILLTFAVILSGRTATTPMPTSSPTPTAIQTATRVLTSSVVVVSAGVLQPYKSEVRLGLWAKRGDCIAHEIAALPLNALQFNY